MKINVVDVESTCWKTKQDQRRQQSEIIEIGIVTLDLDDLIIEKTRSILVRPEFSTVSKFCTELTTLTQEQVDEGIPFPDACQILQSEFNSNKIYWGSWGNYDRNQFGRNCDFHRCNYPFHSKHLNIKMLFAMMNGLEREIGVKEACDIIDIEFEGTLHRALDDAEHIAKIYVSLLQQFRHGNIENPISTSIS